MPVGVDRQAPPAVMMQQLRTTLQQRMAAAEAAAPRLAALVGVGASTERQISVRVNSVGNLEGITISSWTAELPLTEINDVVAEALERAIEDLHRQRRAVLGETVVD